MKIFKTLTRVFTKLIALVLILFLFLMPLTESYFFDLEISVNNILAAGVLDLVVDSQQDNFSSDQFDVLHLKPGEVVSRDILVGKTANSNPLKHKVNYQYSAGSQDLCFQLELEVIYNHSNGQQIKYTGLLVDLVDFTDGDFFVPHPTDQFDTDPSDGVWQSFTYNVFLPQDLEEEYQDLTCGFNLVFSAWQQESDGTWGFTDEEVLAGNEVGSGDWTAPGAPTGLTIYKGHDPASWEEVGCGGFTNDTHITIDWADNGESDLAYYWFGTQFNPKHRQVSASQSFYNANMTPGHNPYYYTVIAVDEDGNESEPSDLCYLTLDTGVSQTSLITSNSPERVVAEDVLNGDFDEGGDGLDGWDWEGEVEVIGEDGFDTDGNLVEDLFIDPADIPEAVDNEHMVKISPSLLESGQDEAGEFLYYSMLTQEIPNSAKTLSFWYNVGTEDSIGADNPGFSAYINDQEIYQVWAEDVNWEDDLAFSGWKKVYYNLSSIDMDEHPLLTLVFYAGNKGDELFDTWVYLDKISTLDTVVNGDTKLYLESAEGLSPQHIYYQLGSCGSEAEVLEYDLGSYPEGGFSLVERTLDDKFCFWTEDEAGNKEEKQEIILIYDNDKPDPVLDLVVEDFGEGEFELSWTAVNPNDEATGSDTSAGYVVKYSNLPIEDDTDFELAEATSSSAPRPADSLESLEVKGLVPFTSYYFAVKAVDLAGNQSDLDIDGGSVANSGSFIVLNEIMYHPEVEGGSMPEGEWVELYNNTDDDVDVAGWEIRDDDGHTIVVSFSNSDNNGNLEDDGETVVPASGWLVVYKNGSSIFNNDGDTVELYNLSSALVDSHTYAGGKGENVTEARVPDGSGGLWQDPLPTPGRKNVVNVFELEPQIKIWQQNENNAKIGIFDAVNYSQALCTITYNHQEEGMLEPMPEGFSKIVLIDGQDIYVKDLYFGTESGGVFTPHAKITEVGLECKLTGSGIPDRSLNVSLGEPWRE